MTYTIWFGIRGGRIRDGIVLNTPPNVNSAEKSANVIHTIGDKPLRSLHSVLHGVRPTIIRPTVVQHIRPLAIHPLDVDAMHASGRRLGRCLPYVRVSVCLLRYSANYVFSTCTIIYSYITLRPFLLFTVLLIPEVWDFTVGCQIACT